MTLFIAARLVGWPLLAGVLVFLVDSTPTRQLVRRCCGTRDQRHLLTSVYDLRAPLAQPVLVPTDTV